MAVFSKLLRPGLPLDQLLLNPSSRRPLLILLASLLIVRPNPFKSFSWSTSSSTPTTSNALDLPIHTQSQLVKDATHFPLLPTQTSAKPSPGLGLSFLPQLRSLLRIVLPSLYTREAFLITVYSTFLVLRTVLSIAVARLDGRIVRDLVSADGKGFLTGLGLWFVLAVPSIYTNSMVRCISAFPSSV